MISPRIIEGIYTLDTIPPLSETPTTRPRERITVARTLDDVLRAAAIRAVVYIGDQACPFDEEFDGNDFCGMHLIGWVDDEPAASLRMRFFGGFAKLERLAVLPAARRSGIAFRVVREGLKIAARKGFRRAYGHAQEGLEPFWARFGAKPVGATGAFAFSGRRYTEMAVDLPSAPDALQIGDDPLRLIRPEGAWDAPGVLERGQEAVAPGWSSELRDAWSPYAAGFREDPVCDPYAWPDAKKAPPSPAGPHHAELFRNLLADADAADHHCVVVDDLAHLPGVAGRLVSVVAAVGRLVVARRRIDRRVGLRHVARAVAVGRGRVARVRRAGDDCAGGKAADDAGCDGSAAGRAMAPAAMMARTPLGFGLGRREGRESSGEHRRGQR
jgi:predicted GNAT family N-acyltransferase